MSIRVRFCGFLLVLLSIHSTISQISIPLKKTDYRSSNIASMRDRISTKKTNLPPRRTLMNTYYNITEKLSYSYENDLPGSLYWGDISVGSQNQTISVIFDTGSDILWLPSINCEICIERFLPFDCSASTTCSQSSTTNSRTYGTGSIEGIECTDNVRLIPEFDVNYQFVFVQDASDLYGLPAAGLMGLNNDDSEDNFVDLAYSGGYIEDKVYSFKLAQEGSAGDSSFNIGFIPPAHINELIWLPVTDSTYWSTDVLAMTVNEQNIPFSDNSDITSVLFDSGTSDILIADPVYQVVVQLLEEKGCYISSTCSCTDQDMLEYPNITFSTRGANFTITPQQYLIPDGDGCVALLGDTYLPDAGVSAGRQILGVPFIINNFVAFSKRNQSLGLDAEIMTALTPINDTYYFWSAIGGLALMVLVLIIIQILQVRFKANPFEEGTASHDNLQLRTEIQ